METFANRIKELRTEKDATGEDIDKAVGISKGTISKYESGKEISPKLPTLMKLSEYFDASIDYIVGISDIRQRNVNVSSLAHIFNSLSKENKVKLISYANFLKESK